LSINKNIAFCSSLFILAGCAGESSNKITETIEETPVVEVIIEEDASDDTGDEDIQDISCDGVATLAFTSASAVTALDSYGAENVIDGEFIEDSRWSSQVATPEIILSLGNPALVKGVAITWLNDQSQSYSYHVELSKNETDWNPVLTAQVSDGFEEHSEFVLVEQHTATQIKIIVDNVDGEVGADIIEVEAFGCQIDVTSTVELDDWYLSMPVEKESGTTATNIYEADLSVDYFNEQFFFLDLEGGVVFRAPVAGAKTSTNTSYTRTELREMLRHGDTSINTKGITKNNWVFSSAPQDEQDDAGGVDGELTARLSVNHVTTTGDTSQIGRVIIGQIHANDDEPIRLYYRKLPDNEKGSIYFAHEILGGDDIYYEMIGNRSQSADNPVDGIKLDEKFSYHISVVANLLSVTISRDDYEDITETVDMAASGYDLGGQYMYFKAGVYNQNNTGDDHDYVQATFYSLDNSHQNYED